MFYILLAIVCVVLIFYWYFNNTYNYWKKRNVPYHPPVTFFGNLKDSILMKKSIGEVYADIYNDHNDKPYVGLYKIRRPAILIRDADIVKDIIIKDFQAFGKNDVVVDEDVDPIASRNPFFQHGQKWKTSRSQLSYCFTSGKMKHMVYLMDAVAQNMVKYIENEARLGGNPMDTKELASKFTSDNVATCAFGMDGKAFEDPNSEFRNVGRRIIQPSVGLALKMLLIMLFPSLVKLLNLRFIPTDAVNYFRNIIKATLKYRKENNITRNDFLDVVTQMKFKPDEPQLTQDDITAHAISFFGDGFETSSITLSFLLYDLAKNIEIQEILRNEITEIMEKNGGNLTYEVIQQMTYLDCALSESQRLHPPALFLGKVSTDDYTLPSWNKSGEGVKLERNMSIVIPVYAIQHDSKYFANPEKFDPDRFTESNKANIVKGSYLPFGDGPRMCIGINFAILQIKVAAIAIIRNFDVRVNKRTKEPIEINPQHFLLLAKDGLWLDYHKRN